MVNPDRNLYEPPYDDALLYDGDLEPERPRSRPLVVLLGTVVLAAFAGVVWVAYNQGVKQGQGVPLLQADAGPTRIVPDASASSTMNPAPDKSYERLWGEAPEGDGQVQVMPQAEQPRTIPAPQDVAESSRGGPLETKATDVTPPDPRMDTTTGLVSSVPNSAPRAITNTPPALFGPKPQTEDITSQLSPVESVSPPVSVPRSPPPSSLTSPAAPKSVAPKPVALAQAPTPKPVTPATIAQTQPPASSLIAPQPKPVEPAPTTASKPGSYMIQLGSFPSDALAASAWSTIKSKNQSLLGEFSPSIQSKDIEGKGVWYRLRVGGFADRAAASEVCQQLDASGQACIVAGR